MFLYLLRPTTPEPLKGRDQINILSMLLIPGQESVLRMQDEKEHKTPLLLAWLGVNRAVSRLMGWGDPDGFTPGDKRGSVRSRKKEIHQEARLLQQAYLQQPWEQFCFLGTLSKAAWPLNKFFMTFPDSQTGIILMKVSCPDK